MRTEVRYPNAVRSITELMETTKATPSGVLPQKFGMGVRPAYQNLTLFMTKICDFPYPIYDLTKNLIPYL